MPYQITLPDGSIGMIDDSVPKNRAMEAAQAAYPDAFPSIGEQLLGAPGEFLKGLGRGFLDPVTGLSSAAYTGLRAAGLEMAPFAETSVGKGLAGIQESLAPEYGTVSNFVGSLGGLTSFFVPGTLMAKGLGRAATLGGMATGLGAEEARSRVDQARAEGMEVTPGQEFAAQLGGTAIGLTELAPLEKLTGPLQAVLRGIKKSDADMIAPGLFNSAKRIVETAGIEGLQEGMANIAQDLLAKGIYNPNLDIGESALGDAAMGASVGAFAQGVIELATKGRRKTLYENLKAEEDAKTRVAEAEKARLAQETARKEALEGLGVQSQPLLLAAPQAPVKTDLDNAIFSPFTPFSRQELDKDVVKELDKRRQEAGRPKTETFTVQDIADTGVYRGELNRLMAQRSGFTGEIRFKPSEVIGLAEQKNIDTSTQGFSDLVSRVTGVKPRPEATGIKALQGLNDVELFTVREALNKLPNYEQLKILPTGKSAKIFDEKQANKTLTSIKKTIGEDLKSEGLGETSILKEIGDYSGLKDVNDQRSLLEKYIADGELDRVSTPAFAVLDANGRQVSVVKPDAEGRLTEKERLAAKAQAQKIGGSIKDTTINQIYVPTVAKKLLPGLNIKQGMITDEKIESYDIVTTGGIKIGKARSITEAEAKKNRAIEIRKEDQQRLLEAKQEIQNSIVKDEQTMSDLEALGRKDTPQFQKIQNSMAAKERNLAKIEQKVLDYNQGVTIKGNYKKDSRRGYTLFDANGNPTGTFNSKTEAIESSVVTQQTPQLEKIIESYPSIIAEAKGAEKTELETIYRVATEELNARLPQMKGDLTRGIGVSARGDITAAEERLALQGIFSPRIKERVNELDKKLRAALDALGLKDVRLNIVGAIKGELGVADGAYAARLIKIALDAENPMRVLRHEAIHALKELGAFTPDQWRVLENKAKSEWIKKYNIVERYQGLDPESMIEEAISDAFSDFSQTKPPAGLIRNIFEKIKNFFTRLDNAFKGLGFQTAGDVFTQVERGQLLPGMGERAAEVQGLQAQRVVAETPERYSLKRVAPSKVVSSVIEDLGLSDAEAAATSLGLQTGKGGTNAFKQQDIGGIPEIIAFLENRYKNSGLPDLDITQESDRDLLSKLLAAEVLSAIRSGGANIQWYDKVIDQMLGMASLKYPELRTDSNAQAAFRIAISVSSQGQNVEDNLKFGERVYEQFSQNAQRGTPRFPEIGTGESMKSMQNNFRIANRMIEKMGMDNFRRFLETPFTVQELNSVGLDITGELADEQVLGSSLFGPKIGFGFYSNLSGNFEPVTMDMWFMRTIGRLIGKLKGFDPAKYANQVQRFRGSFGVSGDNGIYSNEFSQEEINRAIVDEQAMIDLARKVKSLHERDFKKNRDLFDSGQREKTDFVKSAENIIKSLDSPKDAPSTGAERRLLRDVVRRMREKIANVTGQDIPPASLQAIAWYPEQELYKALGAKLRVTSQNYANSMRKLLEGEGFDGNRISESAELGSRRTRRSNVGEVATRVRPDGRRAGRTLSPEERETFLEQGREEVFFEREREEPKAKTVVFEVAPNPDDVELTNRWNQLTPEQKLQISQEVVNKILPDAMNSVGVQGYLANQIGSYENQTNPSFGLFIKKGTAEQIQELAKMLGYALRQKSMVVASPKEAKGLYKNGAIRIEVGDIGFQEVDRIYQSLRNIRVNGKQILDGQSTVHGNMVVLNFSDLKIEKFAQEIHDHLKGDYNITIDDIYSNLIEEKDYDYGDPASDPRGNRGVLRERSRTLRSEASQLLETRLGKSSQKPSGRYSLRGSPEPSGRPSDGSGIVLGESQPGAKSFTGTHYGKSRVDVLSGSFYGSGIRGAEASRLAQSRDPRIKRRVYFYVPLETGAMPRPEAGLGNFVYQQTLNNILPPGEIMSRLYNEAERDANAFESAVVDAGYDGYAVPSMGMMVVLNHNVPVEFLGTRDTIRNLTPAQKFSLRTTDTPEFKQWFGSSKIVDSQGRPRVMYHGTARDITEFKPKQAGAIFVTDDPRFAEDFSYMSETWMIDHATQFLPEQDIKKAIAAGVAKMAKGRPKQEQIRMLTEILKFPVESVIRDPDASDIRDEIVKRLPSRPNIVPVYIRAENPFDFENPSHLEAIRSMPGVPVHYQRIRKGDWSSIEDEDVQDAIRAAGFDGFYVKEGDRKNLAVYQPDQLKSVTGNIGTYGQREPTLDEAKQFGLTIEEAKAAQKRGDIRYSLRNTDTSEFKQWFKNSPVVNAVGKPQMMFHGTSLDIEEFIPGETGAIYVSPDPEFAGTFAKYSQEREVRKLGENIDQDLKAKQRVLDPIIDEAMATGDLVNRDLPHYQKLAQVGLIKDLDRYSKEYWMNWFLSMPMRDAASSVGVGPSLRQALANMLTTGRNVMPLYVNPQKPFDYENNAHINKVAKLVFEYDPDTYQSSNPRIQKYHRDALLDGLKKGDWKTLEEPIVQEAIKELGFDAFYVKEQDTKNLGLYRPNQLKSAIGNVGEFSQKTGKISYSLRQQAAQTLGQGYLNTVERTTTPRVEQGLGDRISEAINGTPFAKFRQMFINKYERIEYYSRELAKRFGDAVLLADTSAIAAALMSDRAAGVAAESFKSGIPVYNKGYTYVDNMNGKVKGLMDILMPLAQKQDPFVYQMFQDYAGRRRGVRLDAQGKVTPFTSQELADIPKIEKAFPEFKQVFEDYQRYNEGLVRYMRDTGVIDAKAAQEWMKYGDYIPFYRQLEGERTVGPSIFSAISGVKAPKKLKGGEAPLGEFLETVIRNSRAAIEAGMRNVAATRVVNNFQRLNSPSGVGRLVEKVTEKERDLPDVVTVRENGKDAFYKVADPLLVQSMQALNIPHIPGLDILAKPAEFLREMVTRDPAFIGASVLRESLSAWITTGQKLTPVVDGVKQFGKILANASPEVERLRKAGIGSGYEFKGDVQATSGEFSKQLKQRAGEMTAAQRAAKPISWMWDSLDKASTAADLSTRAEVFKRVMEETGNEAEAVYQAMEVINFSRKGSSPIIQIFAAIIPFLNARIQGLDLLYRAGFGRLASATKVSQQKAFMIRSLALLGSTAMYYAMVQDEEEWKNADQEVRDNYWIIGGMKFPIPFELGVMFKVIPERIMAYTMGDDTGKEVRESIVRQITGTLAFNPIPQAALPLIEASANYSFFLGRDIVGMGKRDLAPEFQIAEGTSKIAIELGQTLGISPMKIDYVLRGYTGAMGTYAITAMDSIIRSEDDATKATWRLDQIPVLKRFMISDLGAGTVNDYYDLKDKVDEVVRTSNQLERTGDIKALTEYLKDNGQVLNVKDYVRDLDKDMKALRESRLAINISRMEPDQKREALDALRKAEIALTERIGTLRKSMGI